MNNVKDEARKLYLKGIKTKEIAEKLGISNSTIRSWVSREKWNAEKNTKTTIKKSVATNKKKLQQKGQKVATKNKASPTEFNARLNNRNSTTHGAYQRIMYSTMSDEEIELISSISTDELTLLENQLMEITVREYRYLKHIQYLKSYDKELIVVSADKILKETTRKSEVPELSYSEETKEVSTKTVAVFELINKYEAELTRIQKLKTKVVESISNIKNNRYMLELQKQRLDLEKYKVYGNKEEEGQNSTIINFLKATNTNFDEDMFGEFISDEYGSNDEIEDISENINEEEVEASLDELINSEEL